MSLGDDRLVLVVDDERPITRALTAALTARGFRAQVAMDGQQALDAAAVADPAAVILDLGLPDIDGIEVLRRLRQWSDVPVIVLTAEGADDRKVRALDDGADDYVTKPFSTPELLARLRVALRHRPGPRDGAGGPAASPVVVVGDIVVDVPHHTVTVDGRRVDLTPKEFGFLACLARHAGKVLTHRMILQEVWGPEYGTESEYLRVYASQIRKKLEEDPARPRLVTEPGVGYRLIERDPPAISDGPAYARPERVRARGVGGPDPTRRRRDMAVTPFKDLPLAERDRSWDGDAADKRVRAWADAEDEPDTRYRDAHVWYDADQKDEFGAYKLLIADVIDGRLTAVPRGIMAAAAVMQGARGGVDLPHKDIDRVKSHLAKYYAKMGDTPPWERDD